MVWLIILSFLSRLGFISLNKIHSIVVLIYRCDPNRCQSYISMKRIHLSQNVIWRCSFFSPYQKRCHMLYWLVIWDGYFFFEWNPNSNSRQWAMGYLNCVYTYWTYLCNFLSSRTKINKRHVYKVSTKTNSYSLFL